MLTDTKENSVLDEKQRKRVANVDFRMVTFTLADKEYGVDIMQVKEIVKTGRVTFVPNVPSYLIGVYNLRGDIIPIIDFRIFFNLNEPSRDKKEVENMVILTINNQVLGVVVDKIAKVVGIQKASIQPPHPIFSDISIKYISGIVEHEDHLYVLLDVMRVFCEEAVTEESWESSINAQKNPHLTDVAAAAVQSALQNPTIAQPTPTPQPTPSPAPIQEEHPNSSVEDEIAPSQPAVSQVEEPFPSIELDESEPHPEVTEKASSESVFSAESSLDVNFDGTEYYEALTAYANFFVSEMNLSWVRRQVINWASQGKAIASPEDGKEFLKDFYSRCTGQFWTEEYANIIYSLLPDTDSKQLSVWNIGCGSGHETYSLAAVLRSRYPNTRIRIYAQDIDLLAVSSAAGLTPTEEEAAGWMDDAIIADASGKPAFSSEIRDMVLFEYHDCFNQTSLPMVDVIFCRDLISFIPEDKQEYLFDEFKSKLRTGGMLFLGENEVLNDNIAWEDKMEGETIAFVRK